jgi:hypothetical protein
MLETQTHPPILSKYFLTMREGGQSIPFQFRPNKFANSRPIPLIFKSPTNNTLPL